MNHRNLVGQTVQLRSGESVKVAHYSSMFRTYTLGILDGPAAGNTLVLTERELALNLKGA